MMPSLYSLGQLSALQVTQEELREDEVVCAFLDDIYIVTRDPTSHRSHLHNVATALVLGPWWKDPSVEQGRDQAQRLRSIGAHRTVEGVSGKEGTTQMCFPPIVFGIQAFIQAHLEMKATEQRTLLDRIDLQSAWLIFLHCASARANHLLRVVEPQAVAGIDNIWGCLCLLLNVNPGQREDIRSSANLPLILGGVGFRRASRISVSA